MLEKIKSDEAVVICKKAIDNFGEAMQKVVVMEELAELIIALANALMNRPNNIEEEVADVEIMCIQLRIMYGDKKVKAAHKDVVEFTGSNLIERSIKMCGILQQSISKSLRDKHEDKLYRDIALVEEICKALRRKFNGPEVEQIKQEKLIRLKWGVW